MSWGMGNVGGETGTTLPSYTYSGDSDLIGSNKDWKIKFTSSGTLRFSKIRGRIDVFLVGGGGGGYHNASQSYESGGGGGYTETYRNIELLPNTDYSIIVGAGGATDQNGSNSSAFGKTALGGKGVSSWNSNGGDGGSGGGGGGGGGINVYGGDGGSDGGDGYPGNGSTARLGGKGQGRTTREFEEPGGQLYSGGGGGYNNAHPGAGGAGGGGNSGQSGTPNTGGGGGCKGAGGSGIVIIRNSR